MTQLQKEFSKSDVARMRNLLTGKTQDATKIISGYTKQEQEHVEGDVWEEEGRTWTIKNGTKQNLTKLQAARQVAHTPLFCPKCKALMNSKYDGGYFRHYQHCWTCHLKFERKLKVEGKWDDYVKQENNAEVDALIKEFNDWCNDQQQTTTSVVSEMGTVENWTKTNNQVFEQQKQEAIEYLTSLKK
jgi:hypothetical protein